MSNLSSFHWQGGGLVRCDIVILLPTPIIMRTIFDHGRERVEFSTPVNFDNIHCLHLLLTSLQSH